MRNASAHKPCSASAHAQGTAGDVNSHYHDLDGCLLRTETGAKSKDLDPVSVAVDAENNSKLDSNRLSIAHFIRSGIRTIRRDSERECKLL